MAVVDMFGLVYFEVVSFLLPPRAGSWQWYQEKIGDISSQMVIHIQIVYIYFLQLKTILNIYLVHADYFL